MFLLHVNSEFQRGRVIMTSEKSLLKYSNVVGLTVQ